MDFPYIVSMFLSRFIEIPTKFISIHYSQEAYRERVLMKLVFVSVFVPLIIHASEANRRRVWFWLPRRYRSNAKMVWMMLEARPCPDRLQ